MRLTMLRHDSVLKPLVRRSLSAENRVVSRVNEPKRRLTALGFHGLLGLFLAANPKTPPRLTFADDPVEDGLELGNADLHVLREGEDMGCSAAAPAPPLPAPPYRPRQLPEELLEVLIDLALSEHFLRRKTAGLVK